MLWPKDGSGPAPTPGGVASRAAIVERAKALRPAATIQPALSELERRWGIHIVGLRSTAADYLLDFRFRVLDADKAAPLLDRQIKPRVLAEDGTVLSVPRAPKVGALRQTSKAVRSDDIYFVLFANAGQHVQRGERVSVTLGDFRADGLVVQ